MKHEQKVWAGGGGKSEAMHHLSIIIRILVKKAPGGGRRENSVSAQQHDFTAYWRIQDEIELKEYKLHVGGSK